MFFGGLGDEIDQCGGSAQWEYRDTGDGCRQLVRAMGFVRKRSVAPPRHHWQAVIRGLGVSRATSRIT